MDSLPPETAPPPELMIVMPVYNEQASVRKVVMEWFQEVKNWTEDFCFLAIDDGSTDDTPQVLSSLREQFGPRLEILRRANRGHGQSCIQGYQIARERRVPYVFQIDSDGQCDPQFFFKFWQLRQSYDVIYGSRYQRDDGWRRTLASWVVWALLLVGFRTNCVDANVPYRLMRPAALGQALEQVPKDFSLANIALAVLLKRDKSVRHGKVPIRFRERYGGEPSVRMAKFGGKAVELYRQLKGMFAALKAAHQ